MEQLMIGDRYMKIVETTLWLSITIFIYCTYSCHKYNEMLHNL